MRSSTQPQFWQAERLHMVVVAWEAIFASFNSNFLLSVCPSLAVLWLKPLKNGDFAVPKTFKKS
jgi:hypothetical protein